MGAEPQPADARTVVPDHPDGPGSVTVISGPTAVGKGTVSRRLAAEHPDDVWLSVSAVTRAARPGEVEGEHYFFVDDDEFDRLVEAGQMLEWAVVHGAARYGTPRRPVAEAVAAGRHVILEIDLQGARQVRRSWPGARFVFLLPPSWEELVRRLTGRGTEQADEQDRRLQTAREEMLALDEFDVAIVNGEVGQAVTELVGFLGLPRAAAPPR